MKILIRKFFSVYKLRDIFLNGDLRIFLNDLLKI